VLAPLQLAGRQERLGRRALVRCLAPQLWLKPITGMLLATPGELHARAAPCFHSFSVLYQCSVPRFATPLSHILLAATFLLPVGHLPLATFPHLAIWPLVPHKLATAKPQTDRQASPSLP